MEILKVPVILYNDLVAHDFACDIFEKIRLSFFFARGKSEKSAIVPLKLSVINLKNENITGRKKSHETKTVSQETQNTIYMAWFSELGFQIYRTDG